jgi:hypothetical protein
MITGVPEESYASIFIDSILEVEVIKHQPDYTIIKLHNYKKVQL